MIETTQYENVATSTEQIIQEDETRKKTVDAAINVGVISTGGSGCGTCLLGTAGIGGLVTYQDGGCLTITFALCVPVCCLTSAACCFGTGLLLMIKKHYKKNS